MADLAAFLKMALTWPLTVVSELTYEGPAKNANSEAFVVSALTTYYLLGYPVSGDSWQQVALWYGGTGLLVAGSYILLTE